MKKEVLRIHQLNLIQNETAKLTDICLCLLEGESTGFLGLENSGKHLLIDILCGGQFSGSGRIYIDGNEITDRKVYKKLTYQVNPSNYFAEDWLVAEYIGLEYTKFRFGILREKVLVNQVKLLMEEFGLELAVDKKIKDLSELEKRQMDLVKAYRRGVRMVIIEDEFEGCTVKDIEKFKETLNRLIQKGGMMVIVNSHSDQVLQILSDQFIIFRESCIVKKCKKNYIKNNAHLEQFLLRKRLSSQKTYLEYHKNQRDNSKEIVYSINHMILKEQGVFQFRFYKGEITSILALDLEIGKRIFDVLSGREIDSSVSMLLEQKPCSLSNTADYVRNKIVSSAQLGDAGDLFLTLSIGENLIISSLDKIPAWHYLISKYKLEEMAEQQISSLLTNADSPMKRLEVNDYITLLLERWYIYKPKVVVLLEPFSQCDIHGIALVKSYLKKFTEMGVAIIIVKSREEYIEDISDHIIRVT